jgi:hypothetical protein
MDFFLRRKGHFRHLTPLVLAEQTKIIVSGTLPTSGIREYRSVKKSELLRAIRNEIQRHNLSTFMSEKDKIVLTGCKHFGTMELFKRHLSENVLPPLLDRLSAEGNAP